MFLDITAREKADSTRSVDHDANTVFCELVIELLWYGSLILKDDADKGTEVFLAMVEGAIARYLMRPFLIKVV